MMTLAQIRQMVDTDLSGLWPTVLSRQSDYYQAHNRYWQGLVTHRAIPADGASTAPDNLGSIPGYEAEGWGSAIGNLGATLPFAAVCDQYQGPEGDGYVFIVLVEVQGTLYTRSQNVGPETWRTAGWSIAGGQ